MSNIVIRPVEIGDYKKNFIQLLGQHFEINVCEINENKFTEYINSKINDSYKIYVMEDMKYNKVIGSVTLIYETKVIHNFGKVAHLEDLIIHEKYRNKNLGNIMINFCKENAIKNKCYKILLDCDNNLLNYYQKNNFIKISNRMGIYFN
jgi:glucosamine-phosphate N-acetyltransferase